MHKQQSVVTEIQKMLDLEVICPPASGYTDYPCAKKGGESCLCIVYRALNKKTLLDGFHMPQVPHILTLWTYEVVTGRL